MAAPPVPPAKKPAAGVAAKPQAKAAPAAPAAPAALDLMGLIRADRWAEAQAMAQLSADPLQAKIVTYFRLLAPGAGSYDEIVRFQAENPDWPGQPSLDRRRDEALAQLADDGQALAACDATKPRLVGALLRCAQAEAHLGRGEDAVRRANAAWASGEKFIELPLLRDFASVLTPQSEAARFDRLIATNLQAAARQLQRLQPEDRPRAEALLALRRQTPNAEMQLQGLSEAQLREPALVLERLRYLRRSGREDDALQLWWQAAVAAETQAPALRAAFWDERNQLARLRLREGDPQSAYRLAAEAMVADGEPAADAAFLAGFVALRRLSDPAKAVIHFRRLAGLSKSAITQGRAHYWLGRAAAAQGASPAAEYQAAAAYPNTFYGQLAVLALGRDPFEAIRTVPAVPNDAEHIQALASREVARVASYLIDWGESRRAVQFLFRLDDIAPDAAERRLVGLLALKLGGPDIAVALARRAGRDGVVELDTGWPAPVQFPAEIGLDPALGYGIIRQESSFDGTTTSPVGARGLMQLMPGTATQVARQLGTKVSIPALTTDSQLNIRLGATYLKGLLDQFAGVVPYAVAGYNAGPGRVVDWLATYGDPTAGAVDMIDWIELIPFGETRNYVQRVIENQVVYMAHGQGIGAPEHPLLHFLRSGS